MRIGLDISQIVYSGTGVGRYTQGLLEAILKYDNSHQWVFFFSGFRQSLPLKIQKAIKNRGFLLKKYLLSPRVLSILWNRLHVLDIKYAVGSLDWFISSDWTEPPSQKIKKATIIHDLVFLKYPETVNWRILKTQQQRLIHVCNESKLIFADSNSTKKDIQALLTLKQAKVQTIYPGVNVMTLDQAKVKRTLARFNLKPKQFILTVSKREPRKNLERLIQGYSRLKFPSKPLPLVIVGPKGWGSLDLAGNGVRVINYVSDQDLGALYQSCLFLVFPSLYEGFGYPLIEAAHFGCPAAVSNSSSLKELGQDISLLFNPLDANDIADKMQTLINNPKLREALGQKAKIKAKQFSWQNTYQQLIKTLENYDYRV